MRIDHIPISKATLRYAKEFQRDSMELALYGGEEYHLVVTIKPNRVALAQRAARRKLHLIGIVTPRSSPVSLRLGNRDLRIERKGWEHFRHAK
jgi:thiamine monophosphate kinase